MKWWSGYAGCPEVAGKANWATSEEYVPGEHTQITASFIRFTGGQGRYAVVVRNELSREKFLAFQTDGETWAEIDGYSRTMPMEEAIGRYMERHPSKDRK